MKFLIFFLLFFVGAQCAPPPDCNQVSLIFIGTSLSDTVNVSFTSDLSPLRRTNFGLTSTKYYDVNKPTVIYTNGWRLNYKTDDTVAVLGNYVLARRSQYNIVYLDWSGYTDNFVYITSLGAMEGTTQAVKRLIDRIKDDPLITFNPFNVHLIGYDLGAQFMHMVAFEISYHYGNLGLNPLNKVNRLTALDPAGMFQFGPFMFAFFKVRDIARGTAKFTDVIHTSMNKFGAGPKYGNLDFYPGGGETQNGCTAKKSIQDFLANQDIGQMDRLACSHSRAWEYYAESVLRLNNNVFKSTYCNFFPLNDQNCDLSDPNFISMGYWAGDQTLWPVFFLTVNYNSQCQLSSCDFYLKTKDVSPYSLS